jgi:Putative transposase of IS4/5 family (DUF4096)
VPEVRSVLLALAEPDEEKRTFRLGWSAWRRAHQAVAERCKKKARRAAKRAFGRHKPSRKDVGGSKTIAVTPEEARLSEAQWALIEPLLPSRRGRIGRPLHDHRQVLGGILWVARTGCSWREMPDEYGDFTTAYRRWRAWKERGLWEHILRTLGWEELPGPVTSPCK